MAVVLLLLFLLVPLAELYVIVQVAGVTGIVPTLALLVAVSVLGAWLVKREGIGVLRRIQDQLARAEVPTTQVVDGLLILLAGALMLTPGFLTDLIGILLLVPPTRAAVRAILLTRFRSRIESGLGFSAAGGGRRRVDVGEAVIVTDATEQSGSATAQLGGRR